MRWPAGRGARIGVWAALAGLVVAGVLVGVLVSMRAGSDGMPGGQAPAGAVAAAADVVSGDDQRARVGLSPALSARLPGASAIAPAGSTLTLDPASWGQSGDYASAIGQLTVSGKSARRVFVGFVDVDGGWRVTGIEATP